MTRPFLIVSTGQSNSNGTRSGGPNPAPALVKTWGGTSWGASDYAAAPWVSLNGGNNNIALALAIRKAEEEGRPVYVVHYAVGGASITNWSTGGHFAILADKVQSALGTTELAEIDLSKDVAIVWAQGEADYTMTFDEYMGHFKTVMGKFRSTSWGHKWVPVCVMGMSPLHMQYAPTKVHHYYCEQVDRWCVFVNAAGMQTQYMVNGTGDNAHWLGDSLWEAGYYRCYNALKSAPVHAIDPRIFMANNPLQALIIARSNATISEGRITLSGSKMALFGENGTADDLTHIDAPVNDAWLLIRPASNSQPITVKDNVGNIDIMGDYVMTTSRHRMLLEYDSGVGKWCEISRV